MLLVQTGASKAERQRERQRECVCTQTLSWVAMNEDGSVDVHWMYFIHSYGVG